MNTTRTRSLGLCFCLFAAVVASTLIANSSRRSDAADAKDAKLKQLLGDKLAILQRVSSQMDELHKLQEVGHKEVYDAHIAVLRARLDMCSTDKERIEILDEILAEAKRREKLLAALPKSISVTLKIEEAQIDRLDIEIELERIKSK